MLLLGNQLLKLRCYVPSLCICIIYCSNTIGRKVEKHTHTHAHTHTRTHTHTLAHSHTHSHTHTHTHTHTHAYTRTHVHKLASGYLGLKYSTWNALRYFVTVLLNISTSFVCYHRTNKTLFCAFAN